MVEFHIELPSLFYFYYFEQENTKTRRGEEKHLIEWPNKALEPSNYWQMVFND